MKGQFVPLNMVPSHKQVTLMAITSGRGLRNRLTDMGLNKGTKLKVIHSSRVGPCIISVGNSRLVLGRGMAQKILVREE